MKHDKYTEVAIKAAKAGGKVLLRYFNSDLSVEYKGKIDPVTVADRASQSAVVKVIRKYFPGHTIIGEEDKKEAVCSEYCWIIDPLDGTVNFIHDVPFFCVSIAFLRNGVPVSGVIYSPRLEELFTAQRGKGAFLNGRRTKVSTNGKIVRALVVTGFPYDVHSDSRKVMKSLSNVIINVQGVRRLGSAALDLAYVGAGRFEAFWEKGLKSWDVAAGSLIVEESGGRVTAFDGGGDYIFGETILASNGLIHDQMIKLIK